MTDDKELLSFVERTRDFAYAIYVDVLTNIDGQALDRSVARFTEIEDKFSAKALFGILVNWTNRYLRLLKISAGDSYAGFTTPPIPEALKNDLNNPEIRATISVMQFISAVDRGDVGMADDIFTVAANSSTNDKAAFVSIVLRTLIDYVRTLPKEEQEHG